MRYIEVKYFTPNLLTINPLQNAFLLAGLPLVSHFLFYIPSFQPQYTPHITMFLVTIQSKYDAS